MNIASMIVLLQAAASLLASVQSPRVAPAVAQKAVNLAGNVVQTVVQANTQINFVVTHNNSIWPNIDGLLNAPYLDAKGDWVRLGQTVSLLAEYSSFGDLNNDGVDDAAVIVNIPGVDGGPHYFLAAMLNQGNILFNIADLPLGNSININSHHVIDGKIVIDGRRYELLGKELRLRRAL